MLASRTQLLLLVLVRPRDVVWGTVTSPVWGNIERRFVDRIGMRPFTRSQGIGVPDAIQERVNHAQ